MSSAAITPGHWRSLGYFSLYRLLIIAILAMMASALSANSPRLAPPGYLGSLLGYALFAVAAGLAARQRLARFEYVLTGQVLGDIFFIGLLTWLAGGMRSGLGMLLLPYLAAAALISRGRMSFFYASIASLVLLSGETLRGMMTDSMDSLAQAAMLSVACFAVAWLAHRLAVYAREKELLAEVRATALAKQEDINRLIIRDMHDGVLVVGAEGQVLSHNQQALRLLGVPDSISGRPLEEWPFLVEALQRWREFGTTEATVSVPASELLVSLRIKPLTGDRVSGALIYVQDTREQQHLAQQMKLAALGRLTANIAHEIRNPLSAIGHANELLSEDNDEATRHRLHRIVSDNVFRLERIVQDVLQLNRRDRMKPDPVALDRFVAEFVQQFVQVEGIAADWFTCPPGEALTVPFDREHLHQILWNLCRNAIRYCTQQPGCIQLKIGQVDGVWRLALWNDGPPIPPELQSQLFEPFFTTRSTGTGLGLYIARELCAANGAALRYVAAEQGVTFELSGPTHG
ncbi:nitrogen regulation protein NR(II) [Leeia sp.]|uniref:two-component system sensor histidine kinase NtrB n=1 Tax=Leeia sp. TaxID=2884678 RepID=UPI0035AFD77D